MAVSDLDYMIRFFFHQPTDRRVSNLRAQARNLLSQGDVEKRTGLLRCYISRVENGHTVPAIETLEKLARALEVPLYQLFYIDGEPPACGPEAREGTHRPRSQSRDS